MNDVLSYCKFFETNSLMTNIGLSVNLVDSTSKQLGRKISEHNIQPYSTLRLVLNGLL